jgi:hypothetical protein
MFEGLTSEASALLCFAALLYSILARFTRWGR